MVASYDLPFGKGRHYASSGPAAYILGGWTFGGVQLAQSGFPLGVIDSGYSNYLFAGSPRPNVTDINWRAAISGSEFDPDKDLYFNTAAFARRTNPAADPFGNAPRLYGGTRSFPVIRTNISVARSFSLHEKLAAYLRWEVFDLFNQKTWSLPTMDRNNALFGKITNASGNRTMQLSLRIAF
jgi:hypothetical protein